MSVTNPSLRTRIYFSMVVMLLLSMLVTGVFTYFHFKNKNDEYHQKRLARQEQRVIAEISYFLKDRDLEENLDTYIKDFADKIYEISKVNKFDINIFNNNGEIIQSSKWHNMDSLDPDFYLEKIDSETLNRIEDQEHVLVEHENVEGSENVLLSTFSYIKNDNGRKICIVHLPYSRSNATNQHEVSEFLSSLLIVYAVLLMVVFVLAYLLSNYITKSLRVIRENFKSIGINKKNAPIEWKGDDEIGALIVEYNHMIAQLEDSADKLARSERESAWREMAKQVAHEIKNPLTPMKLSVQHLQRSYDPNDPDFKEKMRLFSEKMIRQIDTLTTIADEFSNFAKMPKAKIGEIDLIKILKATIALFNATEGVKMHFTNNSKMDGLIIRGDDEQLTRVFNNLIKNGIQAIPDDRKGEVVVVLEETETEVIVQIKDNGMGIPEDKRDQIFVPNFTTKSSGSGLGLAMVKSIVENHHGKVWFETKPPHETSFFVSLPKQSNEEV